MSKKILFINQEITPYTDETPMALLGRTLPETMQEGGFEIRTFMPKWGIINERRGQLHEVIRLSGMNLMINDNDHPLLIKVASLPVSRVQVYFIDNEEYFTKRQMAADADGNEYADNGERAIFFARGVLETVKKLRWEPDIIVCQGWMSAVVPLYIKKVYGEEPFFSGVKVITSLHEQELKNPLAANFKKCLEFRDVTAQELDSYDDSFDFIQLEKMAIDNSDGVIIASDNVNTQLADYAKTAGKTIMTPPADNYVDQYKEFFNNI